MKSPLFIGGIWAILGGVLIIGCALFLLNRTNKSTNTEMLFVTDSLPASTTQQETASTVPVPVPLLLNSSAPVSQKPQSAVVSQYQPSPQLTGSVPAQDSSSGAAAPSNEVAPPPPSSVSNGALYRDSTYNFALQIPSGLSGERYDESGGASTFTFQNVSTGEGFQIYVQPYSGTQVSQQQFIRDEPSGVRRNLQSITIDDATGASFFGNDTRLGDTAEIWFIHGGYLYEVTTLAPLAVWLSDILNTWRFL